MNNEPLISVIIPVYNVEKYLSQCLESVLCQTYRNLEIILVDDGSTDNSPSICDSYKEKDSRIKVIHKENGGLSDARNSGIISSTGEYVLFLDSDDFWDDKTAITKLVDRINITHAEVLSYRLKKFNEGENTFIPSPAAPNEMPIELKCKKDQLEFLSDNTLYIASACNKLLKRSLLIEDMMFEKGAFSEDVEWCALLMLKARSFDYIDLDFYCYRQRSGSIAHTITDKSCIDLSNHIKKLTKIIELAGDEEKTSILKYSSYQFATFFIIQAAAQNPQNKLIEEMKKYSFLLKYHGKNKKLKMLYCGVKILGYSNLCKIVRILYRIKNK